LDPGVGRFPHPVEGTRLVMGQMGAICCRSPCPTESAPQLEYTVHPNDLLRHESTCGSDGRMAVAEVAEDDAEEDENPGETEMTPAMIHVVILHGISFHNGRESTGSGSSSFFTQKPNPVPRSSLSQQTIKTLTSSTRNLLGMSPSIDRCKNFNGEWLCINTFGLDAFLKACGIGKLQRLAAVKAPWPSWEFEQTDTNTFLFINRGMLGEIREEFVVGGSEYIMVDLHKQEVTSRATWEGTTLVTERCGPQGKFREQRHIDRSGLLHFTLQTLESAHGGVKWGRTFTRKVTGYRASCPP